MSLRVRLVGVGAEGRRSPQEEQNRCEGDAANREIDEEAPAPGYVVGEGTSDERPDDGRQPKDGAEQAKESGAVLKTRSLRDDLNHSDD